MAVAEELHFGRAAARLHISAPPLSQRIRELEGDLGFQLFERTSRKVMLTAAGEQLLSGARDVLRAMDRFDAAAADLASVPATWTVGYCHGSEDGMMRTIRAFRAEHPDAVVRPDGLTSLLILDGLRAGRMAVGIVRGPVVDPGRLASVPLARVPVDHVAVPPDHRLAESPAVVQAQDLDGEPVLVVERSDAPTAHDEIQSYCTAMGARPQLGPPRGRAGGTDPRPGGARHWDRLAQLVAGRAGGQPPRRRRPSPASGGPVRRVPRRLAGG